MRPAHTPSSRNGPAPQALVIFGGASGIGLATATAAAAAGRDVTIADLAATGDELELVRSGRAQFRHCDATAVEGVRRVLEEARDRCGRLDGVVITVGGAHLHDALQVDLDAWRKEISFNLDSAYVVATTAAVLMKEQGGGGAVVTTSSTFAQVAGSDRVAYCAAKAGVIGLTRSLAAAAAPHGVRVNCVAPHSTDTPRFRQMIGGDAGLEQRIKSSPLGRICVPDDLADSILFLLSPQARSFTGQVLWVNNGCYMP
ncbi:MAG: family oxidoreductase [Ramlibacter sp.]|jgi:NAD(P)-dependent dehydrogenase (short-subunit alcohol dehydrogenase family)|uniref:SDR family NAD(P)-dependent oxidoreductase n=1 Tax=Ramlibacter sp. TaxID=1917967 RepID=UPI0026287C68|nr:SDR family oxidoreductase [Ramlibacter sp.]MDB5750034.1 family oxidoreductase [Ramlibacter sp.]